MRLRFRRHAPVTIEVGMPRASEVKGSSRVEADVDGEPLWFESPDVALDPAPEAFACAVIPLAATRDARLKFAAPLDPALIANVPAVLNIMRKWWRRPHHPQLILAGLTARAGAEQPVSSDRGVGLCFSGGVDSFYSLLRGDGRIGTLVMAHGSDIPLDDMRRMQAAEESLRHVAADLGIWAVVIRTNWRGHSAWRGASWARVHGGGLAAMGHVLRQSLCELRISASYPQVFDQPWGSHWRIDPLWSSATLRVAHTGADKWRAEKLIDIMDEPAVRQHLRVCRENRSPTGNCGCCEKCLRTMLILHGAGRLEQFPVFPSRRRLADNIDGLPKLKPDLLPVYRGFLDTELSHEVGEAVAQLLRRSGGQPKKNRFRLPWRRAEHGDI